MLLSLCGSVYSQTQRAQTAHPLDVNKKVEIDRVNLSITYRTQIVVDTIIKKAYFDNQVLEVGDYSTRFYSSFAENMDSVKWAITNKPSLVETHNGSYQPWQNLRDNEYGTYEDIFIDISTQQLNVYNRFFNTTYLYNESQNIFNWTLKSGQDSILGYTCYVAETEFRGRKYRVWYTLEIPYSYGPWKLGGLPGLILKAEDSDKLFCWKAIGITSPVDRKIYRYEESEKKIKREKILKFNDLRWKDYALLSKVHGITTTGIIIDGMGNITETANRKYENYIPQLELR